MIKNPWDIRGGAALKMPMAVVHEIEIFRELDLARFVIVLETAGKEDGGDFLTGRSR